MGKKHQAKILIKVLMNLEIMKFWLLRERVLEADRLKIV